MKFELPSIDQRTAEQEKGSYNNPYEANEYYAKIAGQEEAQKNDGFVVKKFKGHIRFPEKNKEESTIRYYDYLSVGNIPSEPVNFEELNDSLAVSVKRGNIKGLMAESAEKATNISIEITIGSAHYDLVFPGSYAGIGALGDDRFRQILATEIYETLKTQKTVKDKLDIKDQLPGIYRIISEKMNEENGRNPLDERAAKKYTEEIISGIKIVERK
ncbi:hypothetical protein A2303_00800 [Candidatus Falkowbacteria bacterium RIFOXYB2_FULL_47_14]|uniref:Uncharacterized protein n=1 Tax=Candidatus Falkowbacteria bacterium RIFOXYA2_FULL_47_19 TaxID=1797994 RepID=A0A1F5SN53_9BACT|nr:MAG: hypothetical protein A2227_05840 [Candidatus Falkowbacteria bacterium RIFOXYA2_FULL_47_19]OGF35608.1 MAG: hypothetical protein A2468_06275 [Candidatus Falkowbacteria bacterium RIFOXYC2_FULL_46_15]OGF42908.1 MAG: hypothetical protein A2303_00800 [Candidatus Falkowbacteria bacterium RIFOXYB2_FULL_47_14]